MKIVDFIELYLYIIHIVKDYHSSSEAIYIKRWISKHLHDAVKNHSVIVLTGARQVGKSTLIKNEFDPGHWKYLTLDDYDLLYQADNDPVSLWANSTQIIIDEVQKAPKLFSSIKTAVDNNPDKYTFILSGSSNLLLMKGISESLAGRAAYFTLNPMTIGELNGIEYKNILTDIFNGSLPKEKVLNIKIQNTLDLLWKGYMPALIGIKNKDQILKWIEGYVTTYLERDLRQLSQVESLPDFRRLMNAAALRCGQILNQTNISNEIRISQSTVFRYINLLETTYLLEKLPAYSINRSKRLIKSPKIMWLDPGLASFLCGHYSTESLKDSRELGGIFESLMYLHLKTLSQLIIPRPHIFYWRTTDGKEVAFVIEWGKKLIAVEVKISNEIRYSDTNNLRLFLNEYPETVLGIIAYNGQEVKYFHEKIIAVPWYLFGGYK